MKKARKSIGLALILIGIALLAVQYLLHFTFVNALLILPLCLIIVGLGIHVWMMKRESPY